MDIPLNKFCKGCDTLLTEFNISQAKARQGNFCWCTECVRLKSIETRLFNKIEVLTYYSKYDIPVCEICENDDIRCLSLDHINNNGEKHRREIKVGSGSHFYLWIKKNNYPNDFQVLCMNHQFIKAKDLLYEKIMGTKQAEASRKSRLNKRIKSLSFYSPYNIPQCSVCDVTDLRCLSLDHKEERTGRKHRREIGNKSLYDFVIANNYPDGFQTLCMNHQFIKTINKGILCSTGKCI